MIFFVNKLYGKYLIILLSTNQMWIHRDLKGVLDDLKAHVDEINKFINKGKGFSVKNMSTNLFMTFHKEYTYVLITIL